MQYLICRHIFIKADILRNSDSVTKTSKIEQVIDYAREHGLIRPCDLSEAGLPRDYLYKLARAGVLEQVGRGLYRWPEQGGGAFHSLIEVAKRVPQGVIALLSALRFHELTTQNPYQVWVAIDRKARRPRVAYPPVRWVYFSGTALHEGIEEHKLDGVTVKVFSPAKTVADCFKYRNKIGLDVALEALRDGWARKRFTMDELHYFARICRVHNVMRPYLEALL